MPRDFVPCLYYERVEAAPVTAEPVWCLDVLELFATCRLDTQQADVVVSNTSHQVTLRAASVGVPPAEIPARLRAPLFAQFYAAMAALE